MTGTRPLTSCPQRTGPSPYATSSPTQSQEPSSKSSSKTEVTPSPTPGPLGQGRAPLTRRVPGSIPPTQVTQTPRGLTPRAARANPGVEFVGGRARRSPPPRAALSARQSAAAQQPTSPLLPVYLQEPPPHWAPALTTASEHSSSSIRSQDGVSRERAEAARPRSPDGAGPEGRGPRRLRPQTERWGDAETRSARAVSAVQPRARSTPIGAERALRRRGAAVGGVPRPKDAEDLALRR